MPAPVGGLVPARDYVAPRTHVERVLCDIWAQLLKVDRVGIEDNFFELGGDSILSIQVVSRARQAGMRLTSNDIFEHQTVASLATQVIVVAPEVAEQEPVVGPVALTPVQCWFFECDLYRLEHFNQALMFDVIDEVDEHALRVALDAVIEHHDGLRLRFEYRDGQWRQDNAPVQPVDVLDYHDLSAIAPADRDAAMARIIEAAQTSFTLTEPPLLRAVLFNFGADRHPALFITVHHLVIDGVSWRILLEDLATAYQQTAQGQQVGLATKTSSWKTWALRLTEHAAAGGWNSECDYWAAVIDHANPVLPTDSAGLNTVASMKSVSVRLDPQHTKALLQDVPGIYRTQINDVLLAALGHVLANWTGHQRILVDLEGHGREEIFDGVDLSRTIGWFTTIFPVALDLGTQRDNWGPTLKSIKEQLRAIPGRGLGYGALRYLAQAETLTKQPTPQVSFNYLGQFDWLTGNGLFQAMREELVLAADPAQQRTHVIDVVGRVEHDCLEFSWFYSQALHRHDTIHTLAQGLLTALLEIIEHCSTPGAGGRTPSDYPLAGLDQAGVDRLVGQGRCIEDIYPLTSMQAGIVFHALSQADQGLYLEQLAFVLDGVAHPELLAAAWQHVVDRTPILRTSILWDGVDQPLQVVHRHVELPIEHHDWRGLGAQDRDRELQRLLSAERAQGFQLSTAPLLRMHLARVSDTAVHLVWTFHHVLLDGWSLAQVLADVFTCHGALTRGANPADTLPARRPFRDYLEWLHRQDDQLAEQHWRSVLSGLSAPTALPYDRVPTHTHTSRSAARLSVELTVTQSNRLHEFARSHHLTINAVLQGTWALLLSRYSGERDICFGVTMSGRPAELPGAEDITGIFINTLPIRTSVGHTTGVTEWLQDLQTTQAESRRFQHIALPQLHTWTDIPGGTRLFDSILVFENNSIDNDLAVAHGLRMSNVTARETTNYPLTLVVVPGAPLSLELGYDPAAFDVATVERMAAGLARLINQLIEDPAVTAGGLDILTDDERGRLLTTWNDTDRVTPPAVWSELFEAQVGRTPDSIAVICGSERLSYRELDEQANRLARLLIARGVGPEQFVGLILPRSVGMLVALVAVWKAGAGYLPIDPSYPAERVEFMLADTEPAMVLTTGELASQFPAAQGVVRLVLDHGETVEDIGNHPGHRVTDADRVRPLADTHPAYVIYTSGSTGRPKGVVIQHAALVNFLGSMSELFSLDGTDRFLAVTTIAFDIAALEICLPLLSGAAVVLAKKEVVSTPAALVELIAESGATVMQATPSLWQAVLSTHPEGVRGLRMLVGGEALPHELAVAMRELTAGVTNLYGPTETTIWSTAACLDDRPGAPPIGRPIANTQAYVLDSWLALVPVGVPGELYLGGAGLARGYLHRPGLTASRFVANPFGTPGTRMYRTGDVVRWNTNGELEYLGRSDQQVKVRGFRIELGEIETVLLRYAGIAQAVVVARQNEDGYRQLVAYLVPVDPDTPVVTDLRAWLKQSLPDYMVPSAFVVLDELPLSPNGKIDRGALPAPVGGLVPARDYVAPRTHVERVLCDIWARLLKVDRVGIEDNFFELGGDSILSIQVVSRARQAGLRLASNDIFAYQTVASLAAQVVALISEDAEQQPVVLPGLDQPGVDRLVGQGRCIEDIYPLTSMQAGIVFHALSQADQG
ncbi:MAG TPA: amino acid adenylation domain-containing protein, partial [Pseudonocardiaceae bacterium]|nr:amino acid adenylation domain-containing protein [Pseudonocardiaceae bacterium]